MRNVLVGYPVTAPGKKCGEGAGWAHPSVVVNQGQTAFEIEVKVNIPYEGCDAPGELPPKYDDTTFD